MRKVLLLLLMCCAMSVSAQNVLKIDFDKQYEDGSRTISTNLVEYAYFKNLLRLDLEVTGLIKRTFGSELKMKPSFCLEFKKTSGSIINIPKGSKLLIKMESGEIITTELYSEIDATKNKVGTSSYGTFGPHAYYICYPYYEISEKDLLTVISGKVVKLRFEDYSTNGYTDIDMKNYKRWKFSDVIRKAYYLIKEKETKSNGIYDGF